MIAARTGTFLHRKAPLMGIRSAWRFFLHWNSLYMWVSSAGYLLSDQDFPPDGLYLRRTP